MNKKIPVAVLVGFLGAGKTTILNSLLQNTNKKIACIVNDFSVLNIDKDLIVNSKENIIEMSNGCICCTLREDLLLSLKDLATRKDIDYVLIESTGIGEPLPIAQTFYMEDLPELYKLDAIITVIDSSNFWKLYSEDNLNFENQEEFKETEIAPLLIDQIEFSNIILLNKIDIANTRDLDKLEEFVRLLNSNAQIIRTSNQDIDTSILLDTNLYDYELGVLDKNWEEEWNKKTSEADEYGFNSVVYKTEKIISKKDFEKQLSNWPEGVLRAKGYIKFKRDICYLSFCGKDIYVEQIGLSSNSDQNTEIVFIGLNIKEEAINNFFNQL